LYALAIATSVWMWFRLNWVAGGNFLLACLFAAPMLSTTNLHWLARPHIFGWLALLGMVWLCELMWGRRSRLPKFSPQTVLQLLIVAASSAVWGNVHGSFVLAPVIG